MASTMENNSAGSCFFIGLPPVYLDGKRSRIVAEKVSFVTELASLWNAHQHVTSTGYPGQRHRLRAPRCVPRNRHLSI
jgi:hypothetical protein